MATKQHFESGPMKKAKPPKGRLKKRPKANGAAGPAVSADAVPKGATIYDFWAFLPRHDYVYSPSGRHWPMSTIDSIFSSVELLGANGKPLLDDEGKPQRMKASKWLDNNHHVEELTWAPGQPFILANTLATEDGLIPRENNNTFNQYRPTRLVPGDASKAQPWLDHCHLVYGEQADHMILWFAHRTQKPWEKINHALVMGGAQGIGKDTILEPVKRAIGSSNFKEVSPSNMGETFNDWVKAVILRISEARDLGDVSRYAFYEHSKIYTAAPPDVLRCNMKNTPAFYLPNVVGCILTTNHKTTGIFLPADDRRHFVGWSNKTKEDFSDSYWNKIWGFYDSGGDAHVMAYLLQLDLSSFNPKAPPPKTQAWHDIVDANITGEDSELADTLDRLGTDDPNDKDQKIWPDVVTVEMVKREASDGFYKWLEDGSNGRTINYRFDNCGYEMVRAKTNKGRWIINRKRQAVYAKKSLSPHEQYAKAEQLRDSYKRHSEKDREPTLQPDLYDDPTENP